MLAVLQKKKKRALEVFHPHFISFHCCVLVRLCVCCLSGSVIWGSSFLGCRLLFVGLLVWVDAQREVFLRVICFGTSAPTCCLLVCNKNKIGMKHLLTSYSFTLIPPMMCSCLNLIIIALGYAGGEDPTCLGMGSSCSLYLGW